MARALTVTVDAAYFDEMDRIQRRLKELGVEVDSSIPEIGAIFAHGEPSLASAIRAVAGVLDVREDRGFRLPPMDEAIPQ